MYLIYIGLVFNKCYVLGLVFGEKKMLELR